MIISHCRSYARYFGVSVETRFRCGWDHLSWFCYIFSAKFRAHSPAFILTAMFQVNFCQQIPLSMFPTLVLEENSLGYVTQSHDERSIIICRRNRQEYIGPFASARTSIQTDDISWCALSLPIGGIIQILQLQLLLIDALIWSVESLTIVTVSLNLSCHEALNF